MQWLCSPDLLSIFIVTLVHGYSTCFAAVWKVFYCYYSPAAQCQSVDQQGSHQAKPPFVNLVVRGIISFSTNYQLYLSTRGKYLFELRNSKKKLFSSRHKRANRKVLVSSVTNYWEEEQKLTDNCGKRWFSSRKRVEEKISLSFKLSWPLSKLERGCCQKGSLWQKTRKDLSFREIFKAVKTFNNTLSTPEISQVHKDWDLKSVRIPLYCHLLECWMGFWNIIYANFPKSKFKQRWLVPTLGQV